MCGNPYWNDYTSLTTCTCTCITNLASTILLLFVKHMCKCLFVILFFLICIKWIMNSTEYWSRSFNCIVDFYLSKKTFHLSAWHWCRFREPWKLPIRLEGDYFFYKLKKWNWNFHQNIIGKQCLNHNISLFYC